MTNGATSTTVEDKQKPSLIEQIKANPLIPAIVAGAAALAIIVTLLLWARTPDYRVLFSNLSGRDGGEIVTQLEQMQIPYKLTPNGETISIPADKVAQTRLAMATQGLPHGGNVGFELMDTQSFGISQFAEHINYQRSLEGELARSIESLGSVRTARVHLAIPKPSVFVRDKKTPRASVVLSLYGGRVLDPGQVNAIAHLVSSSVTDLPASQVTVVDESGKLLSSKANDAMGSMNETQLTYTSKIEDNIRQRIEAIIAPLVGQENVKAMVNADIDFSVGEHTQEQYGPNQPPNEAAVRSQQSSESSQIGEGTVGGVPGALSNQPPGTAASPINNPNTGENANTEVTAPKSSQKNVTTNYEVDRTIRHVKEDTGTVSRLSVAVVVDYRPTVDEEGNITMVALDADELDRINRLVREAMGFSATRGDSLEVVNSRFTKTQPLPEPAWWENPQLIALAMTIGKYLLIALVALILWKKLVKPYAGRYLPAPVASTPEGFSATVGDDDEDEDEDDAEENTALTKAEEQKRQKKRDDYNRKLDKTRNLAQEDPKLVAVIIKGWMSEHGK
ncbi:flagellar basal-body MS-ring/collar protein FliF [Larsenimonas rhizosphaerae]|uniref:Flagellar M-ring protein n=1 Tax=Larsenimonas rhizosphaerae TaxID=2944682 RepID=A0AA41ZK58_9GAMM|nr:flagellar basal-body MS-ring/collar protein FliF [Larsenimonas rhizosphaerae]MCM2130418.1 flagellar M-ring protein FliF [Larsenimonas rhizosphaerae]MCX2523123.1 flagellar basal-body MS-ring/collar protein FliF [Larsenimonas rhizosphaerae]